MNIFLDESVPQWLGYRLKEHVVESSASMDWRGIQNGTLLRLIGAAGFDVLITADKNMRHQQQMNNFEFCTLVLSTNHSDTIRSNVQAIRDALAIVQPGTVVHVDCGKQVHGKHRQR